jgi:hypothetical protein
MEKPVLNGLFDMQTNMHTWIMADVLFYTFNILLNKNTSTYEVMILAMLDIFLFVAKDDKDKLKIFHSLPKLFLLHIRNNPVLTLMTTFFLAVHLIQHKKSSSVITLFTAITLAIFGASFGISRIVSCGLLTGVMAAYMYIWENSDTLPPVQPEAPVIQPSSPDLPTDDHMVKDQAIAQDLVSKLKKLKAALIIEMENTKKMFNSKDRSPKSRRSRSVGWVR